MKGTHRRRCAHPHADTPINIGLYRVCTPTVATISLPVHQPHLPRSLRRRRRHLHPSAEERTRRLDWLRLSTHKPTCHYTLSVAERQHEAEEKLERYLKEKKKKISRQTWSHWDGRRKYISELSECIYNKWIFTSRGLSGISEFLMPHLMNLRIHSRGERYEWNINYTFIWDHRCLNFAFNDAEVCLSKWQVRGQCATCVNVRYPQNV